MMKSIKKAFDKDSFKAIMIFMVLVWLAFMICLLSGCARLQVGDIEYWRIGNQHIEGSITSPDGWRVELRQDSKTEALKELLQIAGSVLK